MPKTMVGLLLLLAVLALPFAHEAFALSPPPPAAHIDEAAVNARIDARLHSVLKDLARRSRLEAQQSSSLP